MPSVCLPVCLCLTLSLFIYLFFLSLLLSLFALSLSLFLSVSVCLCLSLSLSLSLSLLLCVYARGRLIVCAKLFFQNTLPLQMHNGVHLNNDCFPPKNTRACAFFQVTVFSIVNDILPNTTLPLDVLSSQEIQQLKQNYSRNINAITSWARAGVRMWCCCIAFDL